MSEDRAAEVAALAAEVSDQLAFFREIGITDIGGSIRQTPGSRSPESPSLYGADDQASPFRDGPSTNATEGATDDRTQPNQRQLDLFGEVDSSAISTTNVRTKPSTAQATSSLDLPSDGSLEEIRNDLGECTRCRLHEHRTTIVFGEGNPAAELVFVGEGPGAEEDRTGRPFVGKAGKLLDKIIEAMGMSRADVYIANVVKCRPPENRTPERDEAATCSPFLFRQLGFIRPRVIVALGAPALQCLTGSREGITRARGHWQDWHGIRVMPTYHPAYLLRVPDKKKETWEDMKRVRDYLLNGQVFS